MAKKIYTREPTEVRAVGLTGTDLQRVLLETIKTMMNNIQIKYEPSAKGGPKAPKGKGWEGHYYIPNNSWISFLQALNVASSHLHPDFSARLKFVDCGCGPGITLLLAESMGYDITGIELDKSLVDLANMIAMKQHFPENTIIHGNILEEDYGGYDLIYYYCPIRTIEAEQKFEKRVEDQMKVGALLMPSLKQDRTFETDGRFQEVKAPVTHLPLYKKVRA